MSVSAERETIEAWRDYYAGLKDAYLFPNEFVVRTFLASYPGLRLPRDYGGKSICDVSCGDGRNLVLLDKLGADLYATEVSQDVCDITREKLRRHPDRIEVDIRPGLNWSLPFEDGKFDYLLSWNAIYYMRDAAADFQEHVREHARVLRPGGHLVCSVPAPTCFSLQGAEELGRDLIRIRPADKWSMLTGMIYRRFRDQADVERAFGERFTDFQWTTFSADCFGLRLDYLIFVCRKA